jgi:hypothetical protein
MRTIGSIAFISGAALALQGCVARTAYNVATAPVKATAKVADWATVSGDEADRERGRELRKKCRARYDPYYCEK